MNGRQAPNLLALVREEADLLDRWAVQSQDGGWSTHQVDPMRKRASELRTAAIRADLALSILPLTMETVRQYLGEQIPGFVATLAAARGQSIRELLGSLERGEVTQVSAIADLARLAITRSDTTTASPASRP